mgnify:CR=1 FL=1
MKKILLGVFWILSYVSLGCSAQTQVSVDLVQPSQLLRMAAKYKYGIGVDVNAVRAVKIYTYLYKHGNMVAANELGRMYLNGNGTGKDPETAKMLFIQAAKKGNTKALCNLALMYQKGLDGEVRPTIAYKLYKMASERGSAQGCYGVGYLLFKGEGVKQNYAKAIEYLKKGAEKQVAGCNLLLGLYYAYGYDGNPDYEKAKERFDLASEEKHGWTVNLSELLDSIKEFNGKSNLRWSDVRAKILPATTVPNLSNANSLVPFTGKWTGKIYSYDWSRTKILDENNINMDFAPEGDSVIVTVSDADSVLTRFTPSLSGNEWREDFTKDYQRTDRWVITRAQFEEKNSLLFGGLRILDLETREFMEPAFVVLRKSGESASQGNNKGLKITDINPVPVNDGNLTVEVQSEKNQTVKINICSLYGNIIQPVGQEILTKGQNIISSHVNLPSGYYVYVISGDKGEKCSKNILMK